MNSVHLSFDKLYNYCEKINILINNEEGDYTSEFWDEIFEVDNHIINCDDDCEERLGILQKINNILI